MITALNIEEKRQKGLLKLFSRLKSNRIRVEHRYCDAAAVKCITYEQYRRRVNWNSIDRFVKAQRNHLLCPESLALPAESGYRRFCSTELSERLCENAALTLLDMLRDRRVSVALCDDSGERVGLCRYLLSGCDPLDVVTDVPEVYLDEADRLMEDCGAVLRVHKSTEILAAADLIVAPGRLDTPLPCRKDALILSGAEPTAEQPCTVIWQYSYPLPQKYAEIKPAFLDEMYFASALYVMARAHELGSFGFRLCSDGQVMHTPASLAALFRDSHDVHLDITD